MLHSFETGRNIFFIPYLMLKTGSTALAEILFFGGKKKVRWKISFQTDKIWKRCEKLKTGYYNRKCATSGICYWPDYGLREHPKQRRNAERSIL